MAGLDDISAQIGELIAMSRTTQNQITTLFTKHDRLNEEVIEQRGAIKILGQQLVEHKEADAKAHARIDTVDAKAETAQRDIAEAKNKGKGLVIGLSLLGGGGGVAGITAAIKGFVGG